MSSQNKLFVGNLNFRTTENGLRDYFRIFGSIERVQLIRDKATGRPRGFGFVTFTCWEDALRALSEMNGQLFDGRNIRVHIAADRQPSRGFGRSDGNPGRGGHGYDGAHPRMQRAPSPRDPIGEAIDKLHSCLQTCPDAEAEAPDPEGLKVSLLPHQRNALAWLLWRETQKPSGGILADDMGLGKTLTVIALMRAKKEEDAKVEEARAGHSTSQTDSGLVLSKGTLIICPAQLLHHWEYEIRKHVEPGQMTVYLYHGPKRERNPNHLAGRDVVVTTYETARREADSESAPIFRVSWARLVLDEAHTIKDPNLNTSQAICRLTAGTRWAVTGTPIHNKLQDLYSLLKFLRCSPFDDEKVWKKVVESRDRKRKLEILMKTLLLRRTKDQKDSMERPLVPLPPRSVIQHHLKLSKEEHDVYQEIRAMFRPALQDNSEGNPGPSRHDAAQPASSRSRSKFLTALLRLLQCCCHLSLLQKSLDKSELESDEISLVEEQFRTLAISSVSSPSDQEQTVLLNGVSFPSRLFDKEFKSTKISAVISELKKITQTTGKSKSVIVSQWTSMLDIAEVHLRQIPLTFGRIAGGMDLKKRAALVQEFNNNPDGPQVMLLSLRAGGVGLNLVGGNHLFLLDLHWNPALEDQACDRIYRVGQRKDVTIHRFVCENTVEVHVDTMQKDKRQLARDVLEGKAVTKATLDELRRIFDF